MKYIAMLIFIGFIGVAAFSLVAFDHKMNGPMDNCIGSQIDNMPCPTDLVSSVIHHASVYQAFFKTLLPSIVNPLVLLTLLVLALIFVLSFSKHIVNAKFKFLGQRLRNFNLIKYRARQKFVAWLALFENSPSLQYATP